MRYAHSLFTRYSIIFANTKNWCMYLYLLQPHPWWWWRDSSKTLLAWNCIFTHSLFYNDAIIFSFQTVLRSCSHVFQLPSIRSQRSNEETETISEIPTPRFDFKCQLARAENTFTAKMSESYSQINFVRSKLFILNSLVSLPILRMFWFIQMHTIQKWANVNRTTETENVHIW